METVRDTFFNTVFRLIESGEDIIVVTSDLGAPSLDDLRKYYPERYVSVGIAEQSLISISAGIALAGHKVVAYGLSPFPITRAYDQLRAVVAELNVPITFCGLNAGLCSAEAGYTHMPVDDMSLLRMLPNLKVYNPTDEIIAKKLARETVKLEGPRFIRFDKALKGPIYDENSVSLSQGYVLDRSTSISAEVLIVSFGCFIPALKQMISAYREDGVGIDLLDLFSLPVDENALTDVMAKYKHIVTIEENLLMGGIGSHILELLSDREPAISVKRLGINSKKIPYKVLADRDYIRKDQGLDVATIKEQIDSMIKN